MKIIQAARLLFFILISLSFQLARAMTLPQAIQKGVAHSLELDQADSQVKQAKAQEKQYKAAVFPTIEAVGSGTQTNEEEDGITDSYSAYIELQQPLYVGGAISAGIDYGRIDRKIAEQNFFAQKQAVVKNIILAYYQLALNQMLLEASEGNESTLRTYLTTTRRYERIGRTRTMDRLQASSNLSLSEVETERRRNEFVASQIRLATLLGIQDHTTIKVEEASPLQPVTPMKPQEAYEQARRNLPEVQMKALQVKKVEAQNDLDMVEDKPSLYLSAATGYQTSEREQLFEADSEYNRVGVTLRVPLFSGLSSVSKRKANKEEKYQAQKDLALAERNLRQLIEERLVTVRTRYERVVKTKQAVEDTRRALDLANRGYGQGVVSSQDVVNFQRNRFEAARSLAEVQFEYLQDILELRTALGIDLQKAYGEK